MRYCHIIIFATLWLLGGCANDDNKAGEAGSAQNLYAEYKISADEETGLVTFLARFKQPGRDAAVLLPGNSAVLLDDTALAVDSAALTGAFYEVQVPLETFFGSHTITFKDAAGQVKTETFIFEPFSLATDFETQSRANLQLPLEGVADGDVVRVLLIDTAFLSNDLNRIDTVRNGHLLLNPAELRGVASGPVQLLLVREEVRHLENGAQEGGKITLLYSLRREFMLEE